MSFYCQVCGKYINVTGHYCQPKSKPQPLCRVFTTTPPTEPGAYWAIVRGATVPSLVEVRSNGGGLYIIRCGSEKIYDTSAFEAWSARLPEVKP